MEISKRDWKLFREYVPKWQTRYIRNLNREYIELLSCDGDAADHFGDLEDVVRHANKRTGVRIIISERDALYDLVLLCRTGVIDMSDLEEFSDSTKDAVRQLLDLR